MSATLTRVNGNVNSFRSSISNASSVGSSAISRLSSSLRNIPTSSLNNLNNDVNESERLIRLQTNNITKYFSNMNTNINNSIKTIALDGLKNTFDFATTTIKTGLATITATTTASLGAGLFEAMDYEGFKTQLVTATKDVDNASQLMQDAILYANKTPFETGEIIEATAMFEAMGLDSQKWLSLTADMAGATSKDMIQAVEAIIDAVASGETERLKEFGIRKDMLDGFNNAGSYEDQEALMDSLVTVMTDRFDGGAEALSKTSRGMLSTVTGVFKNSMATIVGINEDGSVRVGSSLDFIRQGITKVADKLVQWQGDGTIQKISSQFDIFMQGAISNFQNALPYLIQFKDTIFDASSFVLDFGKNLISGDYNTFLGFLAFTVTQMGALYSITKLYNGVQKVKEMWTNRFIIKQGIVNALTTVFNASAFANPWAWVLLAIVGALTLVALNFDKVKTIATSVCSGISQGFTATAELISTFASSVGENIKLFFSNSFEFIGGIITTFKDNSILKFNEFLLFTSGVGENIKLFFSNSFEFIGGIITTFKDNSILKFNEFKDLGILAITSFGDFFSTTFDNMRNFASNTFDAIASFVTKPFDFFSAGWSNLVQTVSNFSFPSISLPSLGSSKSSSIPQYATGTSYHSGGLARINEGGRGELVNLPNGSQVIPHNATNNILNNTSNNPTINVTMNNTITETGGIDSIIDTLVSKLKVELKNV